MVEDDTLFAASLGATLEEWGFRVDIIETGAGALKRFERHDLDAAIVDIGLPDMDGIDVIAGARELGMWAPILVASARADLGNMVRALEAGADDYLIKPFTGAEINARLGALGRRAAAPRWAPLAVAKDRLERRGARSDGGRSPCQAVPREHALLEILLPRRHRPDRVTPGNSGACVRLRLPPGDKPRRRPCCPICDTSWKTAAWPSRRSEELGFA